MGISFAVGDQLFHVIRGKRLLSEQPEGRSSDHRNRREITDHIERHGFVQPLRQNRARLHQEQGISVTGRLGDEGIQ